MQERPLSIGNTSDLQGQLHQAQPLQLQSLAPQGFQEPVQPACALAERFAVLRHGIILGCGHVFSVECTLLW